MNNTQAWFHMEDFDFLPFENRLADEWHDELGGVFYRRDVSGHWWGKRIAGGEDVASLRALLLPTEANVLAQPSAPTHRPLPSIHSLPGIGGFGLSSNPLNDDLPDASFAALDGYRAKNAVRVPPAPAPPAPAPPAPAPPTPAPAAPTPAAPAPAAPAPPSRPPTTRTAPVARRGRPPAQASNGEESKKRGRVPGARKWTDDEVGRLLDSIEEVLPISASGWEEVTRRFNEAGAEFGMSARNVTALEGRFKKLWMTPPPTGNATVPWDVQRALELNEAINGKAGVVVISDDDDDHDPSIDSGSLNDIEDDDAGPRPAKVSKTNSMDVPTSMKGRSSTETRTSTDAASSNKVSNGPTYVATHSARPSASAQAALRRRGAANPLLQQLVHQLDPAEVAAREAAREEARAVRQYQAGEISHLRTQILQLQNENQRLRDEVQLWQRRYDNSERRREQMESQSRMMEMMQGMMGWSRMSSSLRRFSPFGSESDSFDSSGTSSGQSRSSSSLLNSSSPPVSRSRSGKVIYDELEEGDAPLVDNWEPTQPAEP